MNRNNKWFWAFIGVAIALVAAIVVAIIGFTMKKTDDNPQNDVIQEIEEGPETGLYYYNSDSGEFTLHLHSGNQFTLNDGVAKVGEYTITDGNMTFTFKKESNGTATGKIEGDVVTLTYNGEAIRFLKKVNYTVTFNSNGGSAVESVVAINGSSVTKPQDPTKEGALFLGWYSDAELTTPYIFGSSIVTADTTLYARWIDKVAGQPEYTISFEGVDMADMITMGGKLYGVPTPTREGYTFGGWWISMYEDADKLSYKYNEDMVFDANTTLFAVWVKTEGDKLAAPLVDVNEDSISWPSVNGAVTYAVKITDPNGAVVFEDNVSATTKTYDFEVAGSYVIEVTAVASNPDNNSDTTTAYYNAKALPRVSVFSVVDSVLVFNGVEGAEQYFITVKCGNPDHNHTNVNNGNSTVYNFYNCEMKEGGIEFTVRATGRGYADSVSKTFVFERKLDKITDLTLDAATEKLVWTPVANTMYYLVEVSVGGETKVLYVNTASVDLKGYAAGEVNVKVTPVTDGYNSEASEYAFTKTTLAAPQNVVVNGFVVTWDAVAGATKYTVKVGSKTFETTEPTLNLSAVDLTFTVDETVEVSVKAEGETESLYSNAVKATYQSFVGDVVYSNGLVSWSPAIGDGYYEVKVNDDAAMVVNNKNSCAVKFTKTGVNTVAVRYVGTSEISDWVTIELNVFSITFDSRQGTGVEPLYFVKGDKVEISGVTTRPGYTFDTWYTTPNAANGNGAIYDDVFFANNDSIILYAQWNANKYNIIYEVESTVSGVENGATVEVTFGQGFTLGVPTSDDGAFVGWFSGIGGSGYQLTDSTGASVIKYKNVGDMKAYPCFETGTLEYIENNDGTWAVKAGPAISKVVNVVIPETYKGKSVTIVLENAFQDCTHLKSVSIPNTVEIVGTGAFVSCYQLEEIVVREVEGNHKPVYSSFGGALIREDTNTTYLEFFPKGYAGDYTIPDNVDSIRTKAFQYAYNLKKLTISSNVTYVAEQAFYNCPELTEIVFAPGGDKALTIEDGAFFNTSVLSSITLPARIATFDLATFDNIKRLKTVNVEDGGSKLGSVDGLITNGEKDTILYCPVVRTGALTIPVGVTAIGEGAFAGRNGITSVTISNKVTSIGKNAFAGAVNIDNVTFEGGRNTDLVIGESAFAGIGASKVEFAAVAAKAIDHGAVTIGKSAFADCTRLSTLTFASTANIETIGDSAFKGCTRMTAITIPASATFVGNSAFEGCTNASRVEFAEGGSSLEFGTSVFANCVKLTAIHIPSTLVSFDSSAFVGCNAISEITVAEGNAHYVAEDGVLYNIDKTEIMYFPRTKELNFAELPATIKKINAGAMQGNVTIKEITIPEAIEVIGDNAFEGCINLSKVTFAGNKVKDIGAYAFANCAKLTAITFPTSLETIGAHAFEATNFYQITFPAGLQTIGEFAFANSQYFGAQNYPTIPASVSFIGDGAFSNCPMLYAVVFEEGDGKTPLQIGTLGDVDTTVGVFQGTALQVVRLAARIELIGTNAFTYQSKLSDISFPENSKLRTIGDKAFYYNICTAHKLPEGLEYIGYRAFAYNQKLTSITIPSTVMTIGKEAFWSCTGLTSVDFATGGIADLYISDYAFSGCYKVQTLNLPARLTRIYEMVDVGTPETTDSEDVIRVPSIYTLFFYEHQFNYNQNIALHTINVEEGGKKFSSVDGILYENDVQGNPAKLIYCPPSKTGDVVVPNTVTNVLPGAFFRAPITSITFAEKENWDGVATLEIGELNSGATSANLAKQYAAAVFTWCANVTTVKFPAHLKSIGDLAFYATGTSIEFNRDSNPVAFGSYAFHATSATKFELPKVASLGDYAFNNNKKATAITFAVPGSTLTQISTGAFNGSEKATSIDNIPASVSKIGDQAFQGCSALTGITFEEGSKIRTFGKEIFSGTALKSFTFPASVEVLGSKLFPDTMTTVTLNDKIKTIVAADGESIFSGSTAIDTIIVPETNPYLTVSNGVLYSKDMTVLMYCPAAKTDIVIPDSVHTIEAFAFYGFKGTSIDLHEGIVKIGESAFERSMLTSIALPGTVQEIGAKAFHQASSLTAITFGENSQLVSIGTEAFWATGLTEISIPDTVTSIGGRAFLNCYSLASVDLPTSLKTIAYELFSGCSKLGTIDLYEGTEVIEYGAFAGCIALESITIPASVTDIEEHFFNPAAFQGCRNLKTVTFAEGSKLDYLGAKTFSGCTALESITLPKNLKVMSNSTNTLTGAIETVFQGCTSLKEVVFGDIQVIPEGFFKNFTNLETVVLPDTLIEIEASAFEGCVNLKNINIPESVEIFGDNAFKGCAGITSVSFGENLEVIGDGAFDGCAALSSIEFHENCQIEAIGTLGAAESAVFRGTAVKSIVLPDSIRVLGSHIFENSALESVNIPANLTSISDYMFAGTNIKTIDAPDTIKSVGDYAFADCANLESVTLAFGVESLGSAAFLNCVNLHTVSIPATVNYLAGNPFVNCPSLANLNFDEANTDYVFENGALFDASKTTLVYYLPGNTAEAYEIPSSVRFISEGAFFGSQLKSITLPDVINEIPAMLFYKSEKLETVVIPAGVKSIGKQAFDGCVSLKEITIAPNVTSIGERAFANSGLETITFADRNTEYTIGSYAFDGAMNLTTINLAAGLTGFTPYMLANTGLVEFTVPSYITDLNVEGVFYGNTKLEKITIHNGVNDTLGYKFFMNCTALKDVTLGTAIKHLGQIFKHGDQLLQTVIQESKSSAFEGCTALETIDLTNVYSINARAFYGCTSLKGFTAPTKMMCIAEYAFANCTSLESVDLYNTSSQYYGADDGRSWYGPEWGIGKNAFENCSSLKTFRFGKSKTWLMSSDVFVGCTALELIEIPYSSTSAISVYNGTPFRGLTGKTVISAGCTYSTAKNWYQTYDISIRKNVAHFAWFDTTEALFVFKNNAKLLPGGVFLANGTSTIEIIEGMNSNGYGRLYTKISSKFVITMSNNGTVDGYTGAVTKGTISANIEQLEDGTLKLKFNDVQLQPGENGVTIVLPNGMKVLPDRTLVLADGTEIPMTMTAADIVALLHPAQTEGSEATN